MKRIFLVILILSTVIGLSACQDTAEEKRIQDIEKLKVTLIEKGWECTNTKCNVRLDDKSTEYTSSGVTYRTSGWDTIVFDLMDYEFEINETDTISSESIIQEVSVTIFGATMSEFSYIIGKGKVDFEISNVTQVKYDGVIQPDKTTTNSSSGYYSVSEEIATCNNDGDDCKGEANLCEDVYDYILNILIDAELEVKNFTEE